MAKKQPEVAKVIRLNQPSPEAITRFNRICREVALEIANDPERSQGLGVAKDKK